jgi:heme-degrading monooxygenase HmoA
MLLLDRTGISDPDCGIFDKPQRTKINSGIENKEVNMLITVFIKRHMRKGTEKAFFSLIKKLRFNAMGYEGYISGETMVSTDDPQGLLVISRWQSREDWTGWKESGERKSIDAALEKLQTKPTAYESYVFKKFRLSIQKDFPEPEG